MKALQHINKYFKKYKYHFSLGIIFITIGNFLAVYSADFVKEAVNLITVTIEEYKKTQAIQHLSKFYDALFHAGFIIVILALAKAFFTFLMRQSIIVMSRYIEYDLKNEIYKKYQDLSQSFYKQHQTGDLMARISEDVGIVRMYAGPAIMYGSNSITIFVLILVKMFYTNPTLSFYVLLPLPILSFGFYYIAKKQRSWQDLVQKQLSTISSYVQETFSGIRVLKAYNRLDSRGVEFEHQIDTYKKYVMKVVQYDAMFMPLATLMVGASTFITILIVYINGQSAGTIAEFIVYINMLVWPVISAGWITSIVQRANVSQIRINEFLNTPQDIVDGEIVLTTIQKIEFKDVIFSYEKTRIPALKNISFTINKGDNIAIIGKTGSGKSTFAQLLTRLFDVDSGSLQINGTDIHTLKLDHLRNKIGYVTQEVFLFSDTIKNNVLFGLRDSNITQEEKNRLVDKAIDNALMRKAIEDFPNGLETSIGERGVTLSGGQKQRLSIARAIVDSPEVLIFDDCLSAVDTNTEEAILQNLKVIMKDKTAIMITHRISTTKYCNKIIVLDDGKIVEIGSHEDLIKANGLYSEMCEQQEIIR